MLYIVLRNALLRTAHIVFVGKCNTKFCIL